MKKYSTSKGKVNGQILLMQAELMSKISAIDQPPRQTDQLGFQYIGNSKNDSLTNLMEKAKHLTSENKQKIEKAKNLIRISQKETAGTFLTGLGMYVAQPQRQKSPSPNIYEEQLDHNGMLRQLNSKNYEDDLAQLRRMIKQTGHNLNEYGKGVHEIKRDVLNAADRFNTHMSTKFARKLNTMQLTQSTKQPKQSRKYNSSSNIKPKRYKNDYQF